MTYTSRTRNDFLSILNNKDKKLTQPVSARIAHFARLPSYSKELGFQHAVIGDLRLLHRTLNSHRPGARVVVFIDDLDRCFEGRIIEILQAIILVLAPANFFVFLGIDTEMIYRAINQHYTSDGKPPDKFFPRMYMKKILQLSFHLPATEKKERESLIDSLFSEKSVQVLEKSQEEDHPEDRIMETANKKFPQLRVDRSLLRDPNLSIETDVAEMVEDTPHELAAFRDYQGSLDDNPREIKRAVNVHRLMKIMLQKHGIQKGALTNQRQRQLVRWVLFCLCWPELVGCALGEADKLSSKNDVLETCAKDYASTVKDQDRRRRLKAITARNGDELPPDSIDEAFRFVARSALLVEEPEQGYQHELSQRTSKAGNSKTDAFRNSRLRSRQSHD